MNVHSRDEGAAFVWIIALCAVCMMVALGTAKLGRATGLQSSAQNAADAAALSAAYDVAHSKLSQACRSARSAAEKNEAHVVSCEVTHNDVVVSVSMNVDSQFRAQARAEIE